MFSKFYGPDVKHAFKQLFEAEFGMPVIESFQAASIFEAKGFFSEFVSMRPDVARQRTLATKHFAQMDDDWQMVVQFGSKYPYCKDYLTP